MWVCRTVSCRSATVCPVSYVGSWSQQLSNGVIYLTDVGPTFLINGAMLISTPWQVRKSIDHVGSFDDAVDDQYHLSNISPGNPASLTCTLNTQLTSAMCTGPQTRHCLLYCFSHVLQNLHRTIQVVLLMYELRLPALTIAPI